MRLDCSRDIRARPFGGSGSTLIACENTGRQARLSELDPKYCDVVVQRWRAWTGAKAVLEVDGAETSSKAREPGEASRPGLQEKFSGVSARERVR